MDNENIRIGFDGPETKGLYATRVECEKAIRGNPDLLELVVACAINSHPEILTYLAQAANLMHGANKTPDEAITRMGFVVGKINSHIDMHVGDTMQATNTHRMLRSAAFFGTVGSPDEGESE